MHKNLTFDKNVQDLCTENPLLKFKKTQTGKIDLLRSPSQSVDSVPIKRLPRVLKELTR